MDTLISPKKEIFTLNKSAIKNHITYFRITEQFTERVVYGKCRYRRVWNIDSMLKKKVDVYAMVRVPTSLCYGLGIQKTLDRETFLSDKTRSIKVTRSPFHKS